MTGIYCIENTINHHKYIGSSVNIGARLQSHLRLLKQNNHFNTHLQNAVNLYGIENFKFYIVTLCDKKQLAYYEQYYIFKFNSEYNIDREVVRHQHPKEVIDRIAIKNRGKKRSDKTKKLISEAAKRRTINPMQGIHRYGKDAPMFGKTHTAETKFKISKSKLDKNLGIGVIAIKDNTSYYFKSVLVASRELNIPRQAIYDCLKGKRRSYKQYKFIQNGK